jgi:methylated-DNA-[protein]-cysteine S-methyltransferase
MFIYAQDMDIGRLSIAEENGSIARVYFETDCFPKDVDVKNTELIQKAFNQLNAYLAGRLRVFDLPLSPQGTPFQQKVWQAVSICKFGTTTSYKDIASQIGSPKAVRAVGTAIGRNPIPVFIPCHRIIGSNGAITGYRGGVELKKRLLALEKPN